MTQPTTEPPAATVQCARCGYDLRGLEVSSRCPECGLEIRHSLEAGGEIHRSRPAWIRSLSVATLLLLVLFAGTIVLGMGGFDWMLYRPAGYGVALAFGITFAVSAWLLTRPENPQIPQYRLRSVRLVLRGSSLAVPPAAVLFLYFLRRQPAHWEYGFALLCVILASAAFPLFEVLRELAIRTHGGTLARGCKVVGWGLAITALGWASLGLIPGLIRSHGGVLTFVVFVLLLSSALLGLWAAVILAAIATALRNAARAARTDMMVANAPEIGSNSGSIPSDP